jgi:hypothetical protein
MVVSKERAWPRLQNSGKCCLARNDGQAARHSNPACLATLLGSQRAHQTKSQSPFGRRILAAGEAAGGEGGLTAYLTRLALENSSAYAGLLGKVLPTTLAADESNGGAGLAVTFQRVIVWPDGRREVEGTPPKSLPAPGASHALPSSTDPTDDTDEGAA